ncbi:MAG: hypothetical protein IJR38_04175 [Selenomonadaceae bacterium]|nr:hypothetical protein [Selenomonadaceae bacterium]
MNKVANMLSRIKAELSEDEIHALQEMLNQGTEGHQGADLREVMQAKQEESEAAPHITTRNYHSYERDPRFKVIEEGMKVLEAAEQKGDRAEILAAKKQYPRADAFISALMVASAAGESRHEAGIHAMERLLNEDPVEDVLEELWGK